MRKRPKFTEERVKIIINAIRDGYTVSDACDMACIGRSTYYKWLDDFPDFNKVVVEATDLQWKYADWKIRHNYRGYERSRLRRPSKYYKSPNNLPFVMPSIESRNRNNVSIDFNIDENLWQKWSIDNAY